MTLIRFEALKPWIKGKKVLHVGCVQHDWQKSAKDTWIHGYIVEHSREAIGIDILEDHLRELAKQGYRVECQNAESFDLKTKFDIIFAGEIIEHLENLDGFLESCKRHIEPDSKLIITTPNSFGIIYFIARLFRLKFVNPEHTCWFDEQTIEQFLNRHNLKIVEKEFLPLHSANLSRTQNIILRLIERLFPRRFWATLFIVTAQIQYSEST